ncbi:MAG: transglutaminase domain-containing protein [Cyclobacteriaceae bacterium]|nr:transglutaminase domain-containing protein [Cyclobacteriaceae bacterium]
MECLKKAHIRIPGNYIYNITLKGFLKLTKNESSLVSKCITIGSGYGAGHADCAQYKYAIKNIPAFVEEDYLTAKSNYLSALNFELSEVRHFDGRVDKITKEWKDAELELKKDQRFGGQLRRGKDISQKINEVIAGISDPDEKARRIYNFIKTWYRWNETYGYFSEFGIKKAFDTKTGNIGDINLSLIAALNFGGLSADPMLLSTRKNGLPIELHPVLSDFNYVVARVVIGDQIYLLDASDPFLMFGMLPERCINGKGRVFTDKGSFWEEIKPKEKSKKITMLNLSLEQDGSFKGTIEHTYYGYRSVDQRKYIASFNSVEEYLNSVKKRLSSTEIISHEITGFDDFESNITEKFEVIIEGFDDLNKNNFLLNPFFTDKIESNPFKSNERLYPVDFGVPMERTMILTLNIPKEFELIGKPESNALALPNSGGKFLFDITPRENQLQINYSLVINKTVFHSQEYHYLKELYSRIIQTQQTDLVFSRKK